MSFGPGAFRLVLAGLVVLTHLSRTKVGITAVLVFFMLSGYWVTRMYFEKSRATAIPIKHFYLSRFLRLWPAFAAAVFLATAFRAAAGLEVNLQHLMALPMLGVASHGLDPLGISWSLDIEMQFYLLVPLIAAVLTLSTSRILVLSVILAVAAAGWTLHYYTGIETVAGYLPAFIAGALIYVAKIHVKRPLAYLSGGLFLGLGVLLTLHPDTRGLVLAPGLREVPARLGALIWALTLLPFVAYNVSRRSGRIDHAMGDFSYSLYLTHYPLIVIATELAGGDLANMQKILVLAVIGFVSVCFFVAIDRPLERWRTAKFAQEIDGLQST
jgi:peptidoglycan/LPS O-acetylase OafA/YrhL